MADILADLPSELQQHRILLAPEAAAFCGYEVETWRRLSREGNTPPPIKLSAKKHGWKAGALIRWLNSKAADCGADEAA